MCKVTIRNYKITLKNSPIFLKKQDAVFLINLINVFSVGGKKTKTDKTSDTDIFFMLSKKLFCCYFYLSRKL